MDLILEEVYKTLKQIGTKNDWFYRREPNDSIYEKIILPFEEILRMIDVKNEQAGRMINFRNDWTIESLREHELLHILDPLQDENITQSVSDLLKDIDNYDSEINRAFSAAEFIDIIKQIKFWNRISCLKNMIKT